MTLRESLLEVDGVGEETADKVLDVIDSGDTGEVERLLEQACDYLDADRPGYAAKFVRRAYDEVRK